jgi:hypothetical protein
MLIEDLFTIHDLKHLIIQIEMNENDEKMIVLCREKIMIKNM